VRDVRVVNLSLLAKWKSELSRKVVNGAKTSFWDVAWRGDVAFRYKYLRLFSLSIQKDANVGDLMAVNLTDIHWL